MQISSHADLKNNEAVALVKNLAKSIIRLPSLSRHLESLQPPSMVRQQVTIDL